MTLVFTSVTYAIKAQRLLAAQYIHTTLTRSSTVTALRGCGYGLRLSDSGRYAEALKILGENGVGIVGTVEEARKA